jgi:hypothetical protein
MTQVAEEYAGMERDEIWLQKTRALQIGMNSQKVAFLLSIENDYGVMIKEEEDLSYSFLLFILNIFNLIPIHFFSSNFILYSLNYPNTISIFFFQYSTFLI